MRQFKTHSSSPLFFLFAAVCLGAIALFYLLLKPDASDNEPLIGHPLPALTLPLLVPKDGTLTLNTLPADRPIVFHFFASWCSKCAADHQHLLEINDQPNARYIGIVIADKPENAKRWLAEHGNPYLYVAIDAHQTLTAPLDIRGLPDTIVMDKDHIVRARLRGPVSINKLNKAISQADTPLSSSVE
jgi:cytochrome c biogenesis protein CcmG/thiol:disulfide interchange protein DsbE